MKDDGYCRGFPNCHYNGPIFILELQHSKPQVCLEMILPVFWLYLDFNLLGLYELFGEFQKTADIGSPLGFGVFPPSWVPGLIAAPGPVS